MSSTKKEHGGVRGGLGRGDTGESIRRVGK